MRCINAESKIPLTILGVALQKTSIYFWVGRLLLVLGVWIFSTYWYSNMNEIKIAIVSASFPPVTYGGVGTAHYTLSTMLQQYNFSVKMFSYKDIQGNDHGKNQICRFKLPRFLSAFLNILIKIFWRFFDKTAPCIHLKEALASIAGGLATKIRIRQFKPDILIVPDRGAVGLWIGKPKNCRVIAVMHHNPDRFRSPLLFGFTPSSIDIDMAIKLERLALKNFDEIVCPSRYMAECFKSTFGVREVSIIPNVISIADVNVSQKKASKAPIKNSPPTIYIPSAAVSNKGERYLFEVVRRISKKIPETLFFISGGLTPVQETEIRIAGLADRVDAPGRLSYAENLAKVAACRLCVSTSLTESYSMALCEASLFGIPCVAFDAGGVRDIIHDGKTGFLVPLLDIDTLVEKTVFLLQNAEILHAFGAEAQNATRAAMIQAEQSWLTLIEKLAYKNV